MVHLDVGHLSQTMYLSATELGLGCFVTAAINDRDIGEALALPPLREVIAQGEDALAARLDGLWRARGDRYSEQRGEEDRKRRKIEMFYIGG